MTMIRKARVAGHATPRLESRDKVTGRAEYVHNLRLPGMLYAKLVRATVAHGRIVSIDANAASAMPGVHSVVTGEGVRRLIPEPYYGPAFHDQPILALGKVRHVGEPVVAILAEDPAVAEAAAQLVDVEYEEMTSVFDEVEAMTSEAVVHEELRPAGTFPDLKHLEGKRDTNVALDFHLLRGDPDAAFGAGHRLFSHEFRTQQTLHLPLEPFVTVGEPTGTGVTLHTASQSPSFVRIEIARLLGWPENRVRVRVPYLGGGFGAKLYIKLEALAAALALLAKRPVKIALTMEEQFYTITKHASTFRIRSAVDAEGRVVARDCEVFWNGGAYADIGPRVTQKSGFTAPGPYDIENIRIRSYALYTNLPPAGALRGFGIPQLVWAYESHTDMIARGIGMDPLEFRRRNILRDGRPQATGTVLRDAAIPEVLECVARQIGWDKPFDRGTGPVRRGRGIALGFKASVTPTTSTAMVNISADGSATLYCSSVDMGQGCSTAMAQIVAEVLEVELSQVRVLTPDTDVTPYDMATLGSRSMFHMGNAVRLASEDAKANLAALARGLGLPERHNVPVAELFRRRYGMQAGNVFGVSAFKPDYIPPDPETGLTTNATPFWMVGGTGVEVEVDTETGRVTILRMITAVDCGTPMNPKIVESQISGAAIMQLGFTMQEKMTFDAGQVTNASLADYKIPGFHDLPAVMEHHTVEAGQTTGPFGAKGVGESGTFGVSPAIANAIEDAVGVRITTLPLDPETVLRALRAKEGRPLEDA